MKVAGLALILCVGGCASPEGAAPSSALHTAAQPYERDPFTRTSEILLDGALVGYLVEYQPIPVASGVERELPTGSYRIQGRDFEDVGFITTRGAFFRHGKSGPEALGSYGLETGLKRFFGGGDRLRLTTLVPAKSKPPAGAKPPEGEEPAAEGADGEAAEGASGDS